jgi:hypothetical protein
MPGARPNPLSSDVTTDPPPTEDFDPFDEEAYGHIITEDDGDVEINDATEGYDGEGEDEDFVEED